MRLGTQPLSLTDISRASIQVLGVTISNIIKCSQTLYALTIVYGLCDVALHSVHRSY